MAGPILVGTEVSGRREPNVTTAHDLPRNSAPVSRHIGSMGTRTEGLEFGL